MCCLELTDRRRREVSSLRPAARVRVSEAEWGQRDEEAVGRTLPLYIDDSIDEYIDRLFDHDRQLHGEQCPRFAIQDRPAYLKSQTLDLG